MQEFIAAPKQWGNSLGVTIPSGVVRQEGITSGQRIKILILGKQTGLKKLFGTVKLKKSTQELMDEIDEGYD